MKNGKSKAIYAILSFLLAGVLLLGACAEVFVRPLIIGTWQTTNGQNIFTTLTALSSDGKSKTVIASSASGLSFGQLTSKHIYSIPVSPDGRFISVYTQDDKGVTVLNIFRTSAGNAEPLYQRSMPTNTQSIQGFSPDSRYFAYSLRDPASGLITAEIADLGNQKLLNPISGSFFIDFLPQSNRIIVASLGMTGSIVGIQAVSLPDEDQTQIFQPDKDENIISLIVSPDGNFLYYIDKTSTSIYRRPVTGGDRQLVYKFISGTQFAANFDATGRYLLALSQEGNILLVTVFDKDLKQVLIPEDISNDSIQVNSDGQYMTMQRNTSKGLGLWLADLQTQKFLLVSDQGKLYRPQFSNDGKSLIYLEFADAAATTADLYVLNIAANSTIKLESNVSSFELQTDGTITYTWVDTSVVNLPKTTVINCKLDGQTKTQVQAAEPGTMLLIP